MKTILLACFLFLTSCASPVQVNVQVEENNPMFSKYSRFFKEDARYPIGYIDGFEVIKANFGRTPSYAYGVCWLSSKLENRQIVISSIAWNNPLLFRQLGEDYEQRQDIFSDMNEVEYSRYKMLIYAYSTCRDTGDNDTKVFIELK